MLSHHLLGDETLQCWPYLNFSLFLIKVSDYLTDRLQFVRLGAALSDVVVSDVGAPQLVVCISGGREEEYRELLSDFVEWSGRNHVFLNVAKTKEIGLPMVIDFRKRRMATQPLKIQLHRGGGGLQVPGCTY